MEYGMLAGKVAWVTGATGGVGPAVVKALADAGATVLASARDEAAVAALAAEHGIPAERWLALSVDLTDDAAVQAAVARGVARFGRIDILAAVAGKWRGGATVAETDGATLDFLWRVNVQTAFNACRAVLPHMIAHGWGRIITFSARAAVAGQARSGAYAASKAAVLALTQSLAAEVRAHGVTANTLFYRFYGSGRDTLVTRIGKPYPLKSSAPDILPPGQRKPAAGHTTQGSILPFGKIGLDPLLQIILGADGRVLSLRPEDLDIFIGLAEKRQAVALPLIFVGQRVSHPVEVRRQLVVAPAH